MSRYKHYLEHDVLIAARERMRHIYDIFDTVVVMFSGGKDSLVCLQLAKELHEERGLGPVQVVFRDEELIPDLVVDTVDHYRQLPWVDMRWYAVPLKGDKFVLGVSEDYVQWDPDRDWVRLKPKWAITEPNRVFDQYTMDSLVAQDLPGNVAFITGVRASESLIRYRSVVNKLNENYICSSQTPKVKLCKPVYDWLEDDIFKFIQDEGLRYCPLYDVQHLSGMGLRVSTPVHSEAAKRLAKWRIMDPEFYDRLLQVFPDIALQDRYWGEYDSAGKVAKYDESWAGCLLYVLDHFPEGSMRAVAKKRLNEFKVMSRKQPDSYTPKLLLKKLASGTVKRVIMGERTHAG